MNKTTSTEFHQLATWQNEHGLHRMAGGRGRVERVRAVVGRLYSKGIGDWRVVTMTTSAVELEEDHHHHHHHLLVADAGVAAMACQPARHPHNREAQVAARLPGRWVDLRLVILLLTSPGFSRIPGIANTRQWS